MGGIKESTPAKIGIFALVLLMTGAIDSVRNLSTTALFGTSLFFFFTLAACIFLIPVGLVAAELASTFSEEEGGIYIWVKHALGDTCAFLTIWLQWINTVVWYPTILSFIAGTCAYLIYPELAQNKLYLVSVILIVFWSLTYIGLKGLRASAFFAGFCAILGMLLPILLLILLGFYWMTHHQSAISFAWSDILPKWEEGQSWISLTAIATSFLGMELAAVHVRQIHHPKKNFPLAIFFSSILIVITMLFGSLAIAVIIPHKDIHLVDGVMQAFSAFLQFYHLTALTPVLILLLLLGSVGSMVNWIISPAKGLLTAASHGHLPGWLYKLNKHGVASRILILQACIVTALCAGFMLFSKMNAIYWLFTDLSTELYLLMYVMMFIAAIRIKFKKIITSSETFQIPGGKVGHFLVCIVGLIGCTIMLAVGFVPPEQTVEAAQAHYFRLIYTAGLFMMILPAFVFLRLKRRADD